MLHARPTPKPLRSVLGLLLSVTVLAGCGSAPDASKSRSTTGATTSTAQASVPAPAPAPIARPAKPILIAALGDSITAGSPLWDPDPATRAQIGDINPQSQYEYWARRNLGPNARFRNCGIFGQLTGQIAQRLDACANGAQALIVQGGINDIARGGTVPEAAANLRAMVRRGKALGLGVALVDVLPWNNGYPDMAPLIIDLNRRIHAIARAEHVPMFGFYRALDDPVHPGRMRADETIDGDHPSVIGYRKLGELVRVPTAARRGRR